MQNQIKEYIKSLNEEFQEIHGGSFVKLNTGELFTKTEVQKYIQVNIEKFMRDTLQLIKEETSDGTNMRIEVEQRLINNRSIRNKRNNKIKQKERYDGGEFNIVYRNKLEDLNMIKLNGNEKLVFYVIRDYVQYPTNCVVINNTIPTMSELAPIVSLSEKTLRKALKGLEEKELIKLAQYGHRKSIYINPEYYASGKELDINTLEMFGLIDLNEEKINYYMECDNETKLQ